MQDRTVVVENKGTQILLCFSISRRNVWHFRNLGENCTKMMWHDRILFNAQYSNDRQLRSSVCFDRSFFLSRNHIDNFLRFNIDQQNYSVVCICKTKSTGYCIEQQKTSYDLVLNNRIFYFSEPIYWICYSLLSMNKIFHEFLTNMQTFKWLGKRDRTENDSTIIWRVSILQRKSRYVVKFAMTSIDILHIDITWKQKKTFP